MYRLYLYNKQRSNEITSGLYNYGKDKIIKPTICRLRYLFLKCFLVISIYIMEVQNGGYNKSILR